MAVPSTDPPKAATDPLQRVAVTSVRKRDIPYSRAFGPMRLAERRNKLTPAPPNGGVGNVGDHIVPCCVSQRARTLRTTLSRTEATIEKWIIPMLPGAPPRGRAWKPVRPGAELAVGARVVVLGVAAGRGDPSLGWRRLLAYPRAVWAAGR
jgi:hypothetical protein